MAWTNLIRTIIACCAFLVLPVLAQADDQVFTGTVAFQERIALPADAELRVSLVTLPTGAVVAGAADSIGTIGKAPLQFVLNVRASAFQPSASYGLVAEIRSGDQILLRTPQPTPVRPGSIDPVALTVVHAPGPAAPTPGKAETPHPLLDTAWQVTSIGGRPVLTGSEVTLTIAFDRRSGGDSGCNDYFTQAEIKEDALSFGPVAGTRVACTPELMNQEAALFAALAATRSHEGGEGHMRLLDAAGVPLIGLVRIP